MSDALPLGLKPIEIIRGSYRLFGLRAAAWIALLLLWMAITGYAMKGHPADVAGLHHDTALAISMAVTLLLAFNVLVEILSWGYAYANLLQRRQAVAWIGTSPPPAILMDFFRFEVSQLPRPYTAAEIRNTAMFRCVLVELAPGEAAKEPDWLVDLRRACEKGRVIIWEQSRPWRPSIGEQDSLLSSATAGMLYSS